MKKNDRTINSTLLYFNIDKLKSRVLGDYFNKYSEIYNELLDWYKKGKLNNKEDISHGIETAPKSLVRLLNGSNLGKQLVKVI